MEDSSRQDQRMEKYASEVSKNDTVKAKVECINRWALDQWNLPSEFHYF